MNKSSANLKIDRRRFLSAAGATIAFPTLIPLTTLRAADGSTPSGRITMGMVGCGGMGNGNADSFLRQQDCQIVAACDAVKNHLAAMVKKVNTHYKNEDCRGYSDFRELMARKDIDVVMLALPDHWHSIAAVEAARQKKDIYGEKPLA